jgi:serine/threonine protein kinase
VGADLPTRIGKYEIERRLAYGGMAEVFLARHGGADGFSRQVVIKRVLPHLTSNRGFLDMFRDEARITARLRHGNIVQVLEFGEEDGQYYLVLEYVEGVSLGTLLDLLGKRRRRLSVPECAHVCAEAARALDYAHKKTDEKGVPLVIIHRDVSPSNLLLSLEGEVKLADFGVAAARARLSPTQVGVVKGKFAYMAPEILDGLPATARSDLFSLGAVLYEMLTGAAAFLGETEAATVRKVSDADPVPPSELRDDIPIELERFVQRMLAHAPERRPSRGMEVVDAMRPFVARGAKPGADLLATTLAGLSHDTRKQDARQEPPTRRTFPPARHITSRQKVLVVEGSRTLRTVIRLALSPNYDIVEAETLTDARKLLETEKIAAVVCQRLLETSTGIELCRWMRGQPLTADVPFVLLSGDTSPEVEADAKAAEVDAVLAKATDPRKIERALARVMALKQG